MSRKQPKTGNYWLNKHVLITNSFKIFASIKRDALNTQKNIQSPTVHARENLKTLNACCAKATSQIIIKLYDL
jgi:hypothetical protein